MHITIEEHETDYTKAECASCDYKLMPRTLLCLKVTEVNQRRPVLFGVRLDPTISKAVKRIGAGTRGTKCVLVPRVEVQEESVVRLNQQCTALAKRTA